MHRIALAIVTVLLTSGCRLFRRPPTPFAAFLSSFLPVGQCARTHMIQKKSAQWACVHTTGLTVVYVESESYGNDRTIHEVLRSLVVD